MSGFAAAGLSAIAGIDDFGDETANTVEHAVLGGIGSVAGGGKFENGAITGAFGYLFNELAHPWRVEAAFSDISGTGEHCVPENCAHVGIRIYKYDQLVFSMDGAPNYPNSYPPKLIVQGINDGKTFKSIIPQLSLSPPEGMNMQDFIQSIMSVTKSYCNCSWYWLPQGIATNYMVFPFAYNSNSLFNSVMLYASGKSYSSSVSSYLQKNGFAAPGISNTLPASDFGR